MPNLQSDALQKKNFFLFLVSSNLFYFGIGLFTPFWVVFISQKGGSMSQFGLLMGCMGLAGGIAAYILASYSDKIGQKWIFSLLTFVVAFIILAYSFDPSRLWLYLLQMLYGIVGTAHVAIETAFVSNLTSLAHRGRQIGLHRATISIMSALAMMMSGYFVDKTGLDVIFYLTTGFILVAAFVSVFISRQDFGEEKI